MSGISVYERAFRLLFSFSKSCVLATVFHRMPSAPERIVGVDFAAPSKETDQKRKILALAAQNTGKGEYTISREGFNAQLFKSSPGWTAKDLLKNLLDLHVSVLTADFPFSLPISLMSDAGFCSIVGWNSPSTTWKALNEFISQRLSLD